MMPWPLTRHELDAMAGTVLTTRSTEKFLDDEDPPKLRWRAESTRAQAANSRVIRACQMAQLRRASPSGSERRRGCG